jgi:hypothetical protein
VKSLRILPCWDVVYDEENPRIYSCRNDLEMVLTQVAMLEKEKAILVSVERRASEEVASLSKCVHQLQRVFVDMEHSIVIYEWSVTGFTGYHSDNGRSS